jgi:hypothetical protein
MSVRFELPQDIDQQLRTEGVDLDHEAMEVYLMEQDRRPKISRRQLQAALDLSFHETERLLKRRGLGQDLESGAFGAGRERLRKAETRSTS